MTRASATSGKHRPRRRAVVVAVCLAAVATCAGSARAGSDRYGADDRTEAAFLLAGAAAYGAGWLVDRAHEPPGPAALAVREPSGLNALDRGAIDNWSPAAARASDWLVAACAGAPLGLILDGGHADQRGELGLMYVETALVTTGVTYLLKNLVGRVRPYAYNPDPGIPDTLRLDRTTSRSFPSGHTADAFAAMVFFASVYTRLHPDSGHEGWIWGGCLTAAATTGYLRVRAGRHFPTDVLAGAALGAAAGWGVPRAHEIGPEVPGGKAAGGRIAFGLGFGF